MLTVYGARNIRTRDFKKERDWSNSTAVGSCLACGQPGSDSESVPNMLYGPPSLPETNPECRVRSNH